MRLSFCMDVCFGIERAKKHPCQPGRTNEQTTAHKRGSDAGFRRFGVKLLDPVFGIEHFRDAEWVSENRIVQNGMQELVSVLGSGCFGFKSYDSVYGSLCFGVETPLCLFDLNDLGSICSCPFPDSA